MKRFLQICSFLACMLVALPAFTATSYNSFYISISDALINAKQGNDKQALKAIDEFAENWATVTSDQQEAKRAVDDALNTVLESSTQEEQVKAIRQLSTALSQLEKLENPVDKEAKRKEFETKYTPYMKQFEEALSTGDNQNILNAYNVLNGKWNQYEQPVRAQSVGMYGQIETQLAFIRITLASDPPDLSLVKSHYEAFKSSIEQFLAGEDVAVEEGNYSLQTSNNLLDDVFHRDDTRGSAEFIHHDGNVNLVGLEIAQEVVNHLGFRHEISRANQVLPFEILVLLQVRQQVLDVKDTLDVIAGIFIHRNTGITVFHHTIQHFLERSTDVQVHHIETGSHDFLGRFSSKADDTFQDIAFF